MANALVSLQNITVNYQSAPVLKNISFDIQTGQHFAVVGKSGSGKSLLLKVIAGLQGTNGGSVEYNFPTANQANSVSSNHIAFVDSRHHFKNKSNTTDMYYQQRFNSFDSDDAPTVAGYLSEIVDGATPGYWTAENVIARLNLSALADKELIKLSNGETKRLRLASALVKNPQLLLLDQPLTGLDIEARKNFDLLLHEIADAGTTVILSTSPNEVPTIVDKIVMLSSGVIEFVADKNDGRLKNFNWHRTAEIDGDRIAELLSGETEHFDTFIKMTDVNVRYGDKAILQNINWEVKQGERWALLGHNGAGKSTLLSLVYGDNPQAYANDIVLFDKQRGTGESIWDIKRKCGFVSPELFQYFPVDNNCLQVVESGFYDTLGLFRMSEPSRAALALKWMEVLDVAQYARQILKNIPASAQRLCLLARALVKKPALLILDEPCQGMDDVQKESFKAIIDAICAQSDITIIYVTHYLEELPNAVNKYIRLNQGQIE